MVILQECVSNLIHFVSLFNIQMVRTVVGLVVDRNAV